MKGMMRWLLVFVPLLSMIGCTSNPLRTEVRGLAASAVIGREISFKVRVYNLSYSEQLLPTRSEVMSTTAMVFIKGAIPGTSVPEMIKSGKLLSGDYATVRNSINICPPSFDRLKAGDFREYDLKWRPQNEDVGTGAFRIILPYSFPEPLLQPMTVVPKKIVR